MPSKRLRLARTPQSRVTPRAVQLFRAGDTWGLNGELRLKPWEVGPLDVHATDTETWPRHWNVRQAVELLEELKSAHE